MAPEAYPREAHATAVSRLLDRYQRVLGLADCDINFDPTPPSNVAKSDRLPTWWERASA
jgi:hypothetical protein